MKKKILAAIAAMSMMATMSVSALAASAACVHNTDGSCVGNGHFYTWTDTDEDGVMDDDELTLVSHAEGIINGNPVQNSNGTVTITLQEMTMYGVTASVSAAYDADGEEIDISEGTLTITPNTAVTIELTYSSHPGGHPVTVYFVIGDCTNCGCGC